MIRGGTPQKYKPMKSSELPNHEKLDPRKLPTVCYFTYQLSSKAAKQYKMAMHVDQLTKFIKNKYNYAITFELNKTIQMAILSSW